MSSSCMKHAMILTRRIQRVADPHEPHVFEEMTIGAWGKAIFPILFIISSLSCGHLNFDSLLKFTVSNNVNIVNDNVNIPQALVTVADCGYLV